jgi:DNA-binding NtrC family response regulator
MTRRLLIVDDEQAIVRSFRSLFVSEGYLVRTADKLADARRVLRSATPDLIITDLQLPDGDGLELLVDPAVRGARVPVVVITSYPSVDSATEALRRGAVDYLSKPVRFDTLHRSVRCVLEGRQPGTRVQDTSDAERLRRALVGSSEAMQQLREWIARVAPNSATVLITGDSGTGKEVIARQLHASSPRASEPFVVVNCGAIPGNLLESELFGYRRGAFSGADRDKRGLVELASGGSLFLDEIGELPLDLQPKLLRALEQKEVLPLGATQTVPIDVRFLAATNRCLGAMCREGEFRQDLYYRLNLFEIDAPPLRDHLEDIPELVEHLLAELAPELGNAVQDVSPSAMASLRQRVWPGNVRELKNALRRAMVMSDSCILQRSDLASVDDKTPPVGNVPLRSTVRNFERQVIREAIRLHSGDKRAAAAILEISLASLYAKLKPDAVMAAAEGHERPSVE